MPAIPKEQKKPYQIRAYELAESLLRRTSQDQTPEGRHIMKCLKGPSDRAQKRLDRPKPTTKQDEWDKVHDRAVEAHALYIRTRDTREVAPGIRRGVCVTCKNPKDWKEIQCGHWISRKYWGTKFHEFNSHGQCWACNDKMRGGGREADHEEAIKLLHGVEWVIKLQFMKKVHAKKPDVYELLEIEKNFKSKREMLLARGR